jgi:hypothetical protein
VYCNQARLWRDKCFVKNVRYLMIHTAELALGKNPPSKNIPKSGPEAAPVKLTDAC